MAEIRACLHWVTILFQTTACFPREYKAKQPTHAAYLVSQFAASIPVLLYHSVPVAMQAERESIHLSLCRCPKISLALFTLMFT